MLNFINRLAIMVCNIEGFEKYALISAQDRKTQCYVFAFSTLRIYIEPGSTIETIDVNMTRILTAARTLNWPEEKVSVLKDKLENSTLASFQKATKKSS